MLQKLQAQDEDQAAANHQPQSICKVGSFAHLLPSEKYSLNKSTGKPKPQKLW